MKHIFLVDVTYIIWMLWRMRNH